MLRVSTAVTLLIALMSAADERSVHGLSVSIALSGSERRVEYRKPRDHFHVVLSNGATRAQRIWQDWNSWGYYALSFELEDVAGKKWAVKKRPTVFTMNYPSSWVILPGEDLVIDVYWGDEDTWEGFPPLGTESQKLTIRAIFQIKPDSETKQYDVWTGRIASSPQEVVFSKWKPHK
jgi:hypothetical protein